MNNAAERDAMAMQYAIKSINAKFAEDSRKLKEAAQHHARVEALCAVGSVLIMQGLAVLFFYQLVQ